MTPEEVLVLNCLVFYFFAMVSISEAMVAEESDLSDSSRPPTTVED